MTDERLAFLQKKYEAKLAPKTDEELAKTKLPSRGPGGRGAMGGAKPKNVKGTVKRLFGYIADYKAGIIVAVLCVIMQTSLGLAGSYIVRPIVNNLTSDDPNKFRNLVLGVIVMGIIFGLSAAFQYLQSRIMIGVSQNALMNLRNDLFKKLQTLPVKYYDTNNNGDIISRFTNDVDAVGEMLNTTILQLVSGLIQIVGTLAIMIYTSWVLTLITIVMLPVMMMALKAITSRSRKYFRAQQSALGTLNGYIEETMTGQRVVKVFNHEEAAKEEFDFLNQDLRKKQIKAIFFGGIMGPVMGNLSQVSYAITACVGGILCLTRGFDVGGVTIFVNYSRQFAMPINSLAMQVNTIFSALAGAERVFAVMDEDPEPADMSKCITIIEDDGINSFAIPKDGPYVEECGIPKDFAREDNECFYKKVMGAVTVSDVTFGYVPEKTVLKSIDLYAKPGQKIAFVGSTGAGKTTITNLINRFYDVNEGTILLDDIPVLYIERDSLRRNIAMVLQDTHLFTGTVKENIRYGRLDATDEEVIQAAKLASAHSFIMRLENGYDTVLDGDGGNLSQGQRQLINIARAAISQAPVLILDEATSSVDTRTEKHIEHGMDRIMQNRTTLVIAHRLSTVRNANAIMVLENGEIIERGNHEDLLELQGRYYELYTGKSELS